MRPMKVCIIPERKNTAKIMAVISFHHDGLCFRFSGAGIRCLIIQREGEQEGKGRNFAIYNPHSKPLHTSFQEVFQGSGNLQDDTSQYSVFEYNP